METKDFTFEDGLYYLGGKPVPVCGEWKNGDIWGVAVMIERGIDKNFPYGVHNYFISRNAGIKWFLATGATSFLEVIAKPALIGWAAKMVCEHIHKEARFEQGVYFVPEDLLEEAKSAHRKKKEDAGDVGTEFHSWVEIYTTTNSCPPMPTDPKALKMAENFRNWVVKNGVRFIDSEKKVYNADPDKFYAGTLDFTCEIGGKFYVGDLKTSSGIFDRSYFAQCAAYRHALEYMGDKTEWAGSVVVRCGKKGDFEEKYSYDYATDLKLFLACLEVYRTLGTFDTK